MEYFPAAVPRWLRALLLEGILFACILVPFIDRGKRRGSEGGSMTGLPGEAAGTGSRRLPMVIGVVVLAGWLLFTWLGWSLEAGR
jgi:hypothetical protein